MVMVNIASALNFDHSAALPVCRVQEAPMKQSSMGADEMVELNSSMLKPIR